MINIMIEEESLIDALTERISQWTDDDDVIELYRKMYESAVYDGCFSGSEVSVNAIADNDFVNWCDVICEGEEHYEELKKFYDENGCGDCSCEIDGIGYIEVEYKGMFLIRW